MYDIAETVARWQDEGRAVFVGQLVETRGFSSRARTPFFAWTVSAAAVGSLLTERVDERLPDAVLGALAAPGVAQLVDVSISDAQAAQAGLSCGGLARLLVQPATNLTSDTWTRLRARDALCLITTLDESDRSTEVFDAASIRAAAERFPDAPRFFGRGSTQTAVQVSGARTTVTTALWPVPALTVVGDGLIADALLASAELLGWTTRVTNQVSAAVEAAAALSRADALVVLSHDRAVDGPALAAALGSDAGYIGALGSRHTQEARADWLTEHGTRPQLLGRIHGPAGLDVGAHTPAEIAVSIVAEVLASRSSGGGGSLRDRPGPVHLSGVQAPPPRYAGETA